jgi:2'-5' RNA ligase
VTQSVELLLDAEADAAVRRQWDALAAADLPSQARHAGATNAPHVTIAVAREALAARQEADLHELAVHLPLAARLGGLVLFPRRGRAVLARVVVPHVDLLRIQAAAAAIVPPGDPHLEPGRWTAHVTLARGLRTDQIGPAVLALGDTPDVPATAVAVRRWDSDRKICWLLGSSGHHHFE